MALTRTIAETISIDGEYTCINHRLVVRVGSIARKRNLGATSAEEPTLYIQRAVGLSCREMAGVFSWHLRVTLAS